MGRLVTHQTIERLIVAALEAAAGRLEKDGHFHPLVFELRSGGAIQSVAVLETASTRPDQDPIDHLVEVLRPRAAQGIIDALAIAWPDRAQRCIRLRVRARGLAQDVVVPFTMRAAGFMRHKRRVVLQRARTSSAANEVF